MKILSNEEEKKRWKKLFDLKFGHMITGLLVELPPNWK